MKRILDTSLRVTADLFPYTGSASYQLSVRCFEPGRYYHHSCTYVFDGKGVPEAEEVELAWNRAYESVAIAATAADLQMRKAVSMLRAGELTRDEFMDYAYSVGRDNLEILQALSLTEKTRSRTIRMALLEDLEEDVEALTCRTCQVAVHYELLKRTKTTEVWQCPQCKTTIAQEAHRDPVS